MIYWPERETEKVTGKHFGLYKNPHLDPFFGFGTGQRTALIASSKTVFKPFWVKALHSRYLTAPTSFAIARPFENKTLVK